MSRAVEAIYPLTPSQEGMLLECLAVPGSGLHIEQATCLLEGPVDADALEQAWRAVIARHPVLRTAFAWRDQPEPVQAVVREVAFALDRADWSDEEPARRDALLEERLGEDRRRGFALNRPPLMRAALIRLDDRHHQVIWTFHHILLDGWCVPLVMNDLFTAYAAAVDGLSPVLPPTRPFRDYVLWRRNRDHDAAAHFWRERLRDAPLPTPFGKPVAPPEVATADDRGADHEIRLSCEATAALVRLARNRRLTLNSVVLGAWGLLLSRWSGLTDVVLGTTVAGRPPDLDGAEEMVGPFFNTLPLRLIVDPEQPAAEWLENVQATQVGQRDVEFCTGGEIHGWCDLPAATPLYDTLVVFENYPDARAGGGDLGRLGLSVAQPRAIGARTAFSLTLLATPGERLGLKLVRDALRIDAQDARRVLESLRQVLEAMTDVCGKAVRDLLASLPEGWQPGVAASKGRDAERPGRRVPPRTSEEVELLRLWQDLLGVAEIGVRDDFFALGGHSLLVTRLMAAIETRFGCKLPLATIFEGPTIERLAARLRRARDPAAWSPLVAIRPTTGNVGERPPLFCLHPLGGTVLCYADLARLLGPAQPVYGLQATGMEEGQVPLHDPGPMAELYLSALRAVQPKGPYHLCGYSFGGLMVVEMARRLMESGETVAFAGLFDTPWPAAIPARFRDTDSAGLLVSLFSESLNLPLDHLRTLSEAEQLAFVLERAKAADMIAPESGLGEATRFFDVCKANQGMTFPALPCPAPLTLFRGEDGATRLTDDPALGLAAIAAGGLNIVWGPGRHETMLGPDHVGAWAAILAAQLDGARRFNRG